MATKAVNPAPAGTTTGNINTLNFNQSAAILNEIKAQATGIKGPAPINTAEFVTVGQTALQCGYDPLLNAISQVLGRTIFAIRPYNAKFTGIEMSETQFGNWTRKMNISDTDVEDEIGVELTDGQSVDQYKVKKPIITEVGFYGQNAVMYQAPTIFKDQLNVAFSGPEQFAEFLQMIVTNDNNMIQQKRENSLRATVTNLVGGTIAAAGMNVIHLLTEYNAATGQNLTGTSVMAPDNYPAFMRWVTGRIETLQDQLEERSTLFHKSITGKPLMRFTPRRDQRVYLLAKYVNDAFANAMSVTFHDNLTRFPGTFEKVGFWQSLEQPDAIDVTASYMNDAGVIVTGAVNVNNVFGVIFDRDAAGWNAYGEWNAFTPFNARGGYTNQFYHWKDRYYNDFTENVVVLQLD